MSRNYQINIALAYTMSDWRGKPAYRFFARVQLKDTLSEPEAIAEYDRLKEVYPSPKYSLTLSFVETVTRGKEIITDAGRD